MGVLSSLSSLLFIEDTLFPRHREVQCDKQHHIFVCRIELNIFSTFWMLMHVCHSLWMAFKYKCMCRHYIWGIVNESGLLWDRVDISITAPYIYCIKLWVRAYRKLRYLPSPIPHSTLTCYSSEQGTKNYSDCSWKSTYCTSVICTTMI